MARPLRIEIPGGIYYISSRGERGEAVYRDDADRREWLRVFSGVCERFNWCCHAYCEMTSHYDAVIEVQQGNLSKGMRQLNGVYTQYFNRRHGLSGNLYRGRFSSIVVEAEAYLLQLARYVVLSPVRAGKVSRAADWPWSSYRAMVGPDAVPPWLNTDWVLDRFAADRGRARQQYVDFVAGADDNTEVWAGLREQVFLGSEAFVERMKALKSDRVSLHSAPRSQRRAMAKALRKFRDGFEDRDEGMARAFATGAYSMKEIGDVFGVHLSTVSRAVRCHEQRVAVDAERGVNARNS